MTSRTVVVRPSFTSLAQALPSWPIATLESAAWRTKVMSASVTAFISCPTRPRASSIALVTVMPLSIRRNRGIRSSPAPVTIPTFSVAPSARQPFSSRDNVKSTPAFFLSPRFTPEPCLLAASSGDQISALNSSYSFFLLTFLCNYVKMRVCLPGGKHGTPQAARTRRTARNGTPVPAKYVRKFFSNKD